MNKEQPKDHRNVEPGGLGNTRILTDYAQKSPHSDTGVTNEVTTRAFGASVVLNPEEL
jgi:hypothetical protein